MSKIKNAQQIEFDNIKFKSRLELKCYKRLQEENFKFKYEPEKILLWKGVKLDKVKVYSSKNKSLKYTNPKLIDMTYTPDFLIIKDNLRIYVDTKGFMNDVYPIKKKIFLKVLQEEFPSRNELNEELTYLFFEPSSVKEIEEMINIIKEI